MQNTNRLPRVLQRFSEIGIVITVVVAALLLLALVFTDAALVSPLEFTPDEGAYSLSSDSWGTGTITDARGVVTFTEKSATFVALATTKILLYAAASITLLLLLRGILHTVATAEPFDQKNTNRIRAIGILIPVFGFLAQGLNWATSLITMDIVTVEGLHIEANLTPNLTYLFIGLVVIALAEAFRHGTHLQADADLTV